MIVDSLMRREVLVVPETTNVMEAARQMKRRGVGSVVVTRGGEAIGILTERDVAFRVVAEGRDARSTLVSEVMSQPLATIEPAASVEDAAEKMKALRIKRLVVALDGEVRGIVTATDVAYAEPSLTRALVEGWVRQRWSDD